MKDRISGRRRTLAVAIVASMLIAPPPAAAATADSAAAARTGAASFDGGVEYFAPRGPLARLQLEPYLDARLRLDRVRDRPGASEPLAVTSPVVRAGLAWLPRGTGVRAEAGARIARSSADNADPPVAFANETPDTLEWDRAAVAWTAPARLHLRAGKMLMPLRLSELVWDEDLRPVGLAARVNAGARPLTAQLTVGGFTRSRFAPSDDARLLAAQLTLASPPAGDREVEGGAAVLAFDQLDRVARRGLARQNGARGAGATRRLAREFTVVVLHAEGGATTVRLPLAARIEVARNTATDRDRDALRTRLAIGGDAAPWGLEAGWIYQRVEREAVPGAFNSDDWWFHTRAKGHQLWAAWGTGRPLSLRLSMFVERRDDLVRDTRRLIADLRWRPLDP